MSVCLSGLFWEGVQQSGLEKREARGNQAADVVEAMLFLFALFLFLFSLFLSSFLILTL